MGNSDDAEHERAWELLYDKILEILSRFGSEDHFGNADYLLVDDNLSPRRHTIEIHKLRMLDPRLIESLRSLLQDFAGWEIVFLVDIPRTEDKWPPMGLIIRKHELVDALQRDFLPDEFRSIEFEGSKPGTGFD